MKTTVILTAAEQALSNYIALHRIKWNEDNGFVAVLYGDEKKTLEDNETWSYGAEVGYCKLNNLYPDISWGDHNPFDAITAMEHTIDVKWTDYMGGLLMVKDKERPAIPDFYALMVGKYPEYKFCGYMSAAKLLVPERLAEQVNGRALPHKAYVARQDELFMAEPGQI